MRKYIGLSLPGGQDGPGPRPGWGSRSGSGAAVSVLRDESASGGKTGGKKKEWGKMTGQGM